MKCLELNDISLQIKDNLILDKINLSINKNEFVCLFGKSGEGKTMLLNGISGIVDFSKGSIKIDDIDVKDAKINERNCVLLDQDILLFNHMNVYDNIAFGLKMQKKSKADIDRIVYDLANEMKVKDKLKKFPNQLSGGEQQRIALARALAVNPKLLLLDEPFSKLDINLKEDLYKLIRKLKEKYQLTIIMVTHDKNEALLLSDKIAILANKKIVDYDKPDVIYNNPTSIKTLYLMSNASIVSGQLFSNNENKYAAIFYDDVEITETTEGYLGEIVSKNYLGNNYIYEIKYENQIIKGYYHKELKVNSESYFKINVEKIKYYNE